MENEGIRLLKHVKDREFFMTGIALYWAEGSKKTRSVEMCNSDPDLLKIFIRWLEKFYGVEKSRIACTIGINEIHRSREAVVKKYWCGILGLNLDQFRQTSFKKAKPHKIYENYDHHYGTLAIKVLKPGGIYYKILGLIKGLIVNMPA